jgi:hypothetical protein
MSDARMFLALLVELGVTASLIGGRVKLSGAERLSPATIEAARTMRDDIIALLAKPIGKTGHDCCVCGEPAGFGEGWALRGPGGAKWYCATCVPSREEVVSVAGGIGEPFCLPRGPRASSVASAG